MSNGELVYISNGELVYIPNGELVYIPNGELEYIPNGELVYIPTGNLCHMCIRGDIVYTYQTVTSWIGDEKNSESGTQHLIK